jgi:hypothetical protein
MTDERKKAPSRSRRSELQALLGELGTVLPRQNHGTIERPAQGWYAELEDGGVIFLGDYTTIAVSRILSLRDGA